jgi:hypothetical protein
MLDVETRYPDIEKLCLCLFFTCTKLRHILLPASRDHGEAARGDGVAREGAGRADEGGSKRFGRAA